MTRTLKLPAWMDSPELKKLFAALTKNGGQARLVGGCVRDMILNRQTQDLDIATTLLPEDIIAHLKDANIKSVPTGIKHGTVTAVVNGVAFEVTTLRRDVATDGRHATVEYTDNWEEDAARRDFTLNAMSLDRAGKLYDYFGGYADALKGHVRFVGDAAARIEEDFLRILRLFRFYAQVGKGPVDKAALSACTKLAKGMTRLSKERITQEMMKLLAAKNPLKSLEAMTEAGVLAVIFGVKRYTLPRATLVTLLHLEKNLAPSPLRRLLVLLQALPKNTRMQIARAHFRLSNRDQDYLEKLHALMAECGAVLKEKNLKELIRCYSAEAVRDAMIVCLAEKGKRVFPVKARTVIARWKPPVFPLRGEDLIRAGMKQGKGIGEALKKAEKRWVDSGYVLGKKDLLAGIKR